jgi:hypothetical protein
VIFSEVRVNSTTDGQTKSVNRLLSKEIEFDDESLKHGSLGSEHGDKNKRSLQPTFKCPSRTVLRSEMEVGVSDTAGHDEAVLTDRQEDRQTDRQIRTDRGRGRGTDRQQERGSKRENRKLQNMEQRAAAEASQHGEHRHA